MLYDIYFHNDFDGHASAAVMLAFLRSRGDDIEHFIPVKYDIIPKWINDKFLTKRNPAIIVDFPYHPQAAFWFDHHVGPFRKPEWQKEFKTSPGRRYDDSYASACHLAYDSLRRDFGWKPPGHFKELVKWLDICDGANYKSAKQTIEIKEPAIQINNFIENFIEEKKGSHAITVWIINKMSEGSLADIVRRPKVAKAMKQIRAGTQESLRFWKKHLKLSGRVITIDLHGNRFGSLAHYAAYYLHPKTLYAVKFHPFPGRPSLFHINVSANPWLRKQNKKNIGTLLKGYGGGGHKDVGGVEIEGRKATVKAVGEIVVFLNKK